MKMWTDRTSHMKQEYDEPDEVINKPTDNIQTFCNSNLISLSEWIHNGRILFKT